ncbi:MAG: hypothetical protein AAF348_18770 [Bacteroidota bacterium]
MEKMIMPQHYIDIVGKKAKLSGGLFTPKRAEPSLEYDVLDWRWGSGKIINTKTLEMLHPTVEFLIKREGMKRSRWTRGFPVREINLKDCK